MCGGVRAAVCIGVCVCVCVCVYVCMYVCVCICTLVLYPMEPLAQGGSPPPPATGLPFDKPYITLRGKGQCWALVEGYQNDAQFVSRACANSVGGNYGGGLPRADNVHVRYQRTRAPNLSD